MDAGRIEGRWESKKESRREGREEKRKLRSICQGHGAYSEALETGDI